MKPPTTCPTSDSLRALFDGLLGEKEQPALASHLESCPSCQQRLQDLGADRGVWRRASSHLRHGDTPLEPALERVVARFEAALRDPERPVGAGTADTTLLDFLAPSDRHGCLGRLAHYEVQEVIGRGGMGVVLKAFDERLQRTVAVKVLAAHLAAEPAARQRFVREAQAVAAIRDEHVIDIHAVEDLNRLPYLVMDYVAGGSLQERLDRDGPPGLEETIRIGREVALGLAAAHARGLVHRDVKPANILVEEGTGKVRLTDFGLARALPDIAASPGGVVAGTPAYMAPEQARGDEVDHRADLFSLGSVLYALCTGAPPFPGRDTLTVLRDVQTGRASPVRDLNPQVPVWLAAVIAKLHAPEPAGRFPSAVEVAELLGRGRTARPAEGLRLWGLPALAAALFLTAGTLLAAQLFIHRTSEGRSGTGAQSGRVLPRVPPAHGLAGEVRRLVGHLEPVQGLGFSPDGRLVFSGSWDDTIRVWEIETGQQLLCSNLGTTVHDRGIFWVAFTPDGRRALAASSGWNVYLWDLESGQELRRTAVPRSFDPRARGIASIALFHQGRQALLGCNDGRALIWDVDNWRQRGCLDHGSQLWAVSVSRDGRRALTAGGAREDGGAVRLWDLESGKELHKFNGHVTGAWCAVFSPDGRRALSGGGDDDLTMWLWDVQSGTPLRCFEGHQRAVKDIAFLRDGRHAVSASFDGTVRLWHLETGKELHCMDAGDGGLMSLALSPDEKYVLSAGDSGVVRLWQLPPLPQSPGE